jgi:hypothetical protein
MKIETRYYDKQTTVVIVPVLQSSGLDDAFTFTNFLNKNHHTEGGGSVDYKH